MKIAITGHTNIEKACDLELVSPNGTKYNREALEILISNIDIFVANLLQQHELSKKQLTLISGMARGVDEAFAIFAIRNQIPLILSIPGSLDWHSKRGLSRGMRAKAIYYPQIVSAPNIIGIYEISKSYGQGGHQFVNMARNQHMVDIADGVISYKSYDSSGTDDCIERAVLAGKYLGNVIPV